jgi:hypothetical protein
MSLLPGCTLKIGVEGNTSPPPLNIYCTDLKMVETEMAARIAADNLLGDRIDQLEFEVSSFIEEKLANCLVLIDQLTQRVDEQLANCLLLIDQLTQRVIALETAQ